MKRKWFISLLAVSSMLGVTACSSNEIKINPDKQRYLVGIAQFVRHSALDAATNGFKKSLKAELAKQGREVDFFETNAQGEISLCNVAVSGLLMRNVDLILANATACFQAAVNATREVPILGTSITSYEQALGQKFENDTIGLNVSGTSDLAPLDIQAKLLFDFAPEGAKNIGLLYCSSEANSAYQVKTIEKHIAELNKKTENKLQVSHYPFVDTSDVEQVSRLAASKSDIMYIPTDNTAASTAKTIGEATVVNGKRVPIVCGEEGSCRDTGCLTLTISYDDLGEQTGEMAADVLLGRKDIREMPYCTAKKFTYKYNEKLCKEAGIEIDERFKDFIAIE